jgi:4-hydroxythreonine-4-phosphate dehydrogenase
MKTKSRPVLGLTMGDPAGIGPEICLRALREPKVRKFCTPVLFGDLAVLEQASGKTLSDLEIVREAEFNRIERVDTPMVVDCRAIRVGMVKPGKVSAACGRAAYAYIEKAIHAALAGKLHGVVTAPIHKESINRAGVDFPGHTEIFTALTHTGRSCMMLHSDKLTVSMCTTHIGYLDVPERLSIGRVLDVIELTAAAMRQLTHREPRIGVCGLNPHAGEHGLFGRQEEERIIAPAVKRAQAKKLDVVGPLVPDAVFTTGQRGKYDAIVTLYHDQGHIPFKMLAFDTGVNITLGLPIIRTSVDHGTAFDIAWQGRADPTSLYEAMKVAARLAHIG